MPCTEKAYFIPVIIIEVTFVNPILLNGPNCGTNVTPEQLTFIVFIALFEILLNAKAAAFTPDKNCILKFSNNKFCTDVCAELEIVKLFKLIVDAAKPENPVETTEAVLNKGMDSKETQVLNMLDMFVTNEVSNKGTDFKDEQP